MLIRGLTFTIASIIWMVIATESFVPAFAQSNPGIDKVTEPQSDGLVVLDARIVVKRAIAPIEKSMAVYRDQRKVFSCHHHAHPIIALSEIANRGFAIDRQNLRRQLDNTVTETANVRDRYADGKSNRWWR